MKRALIVAGVLVLGAAIVVAIASMDKKDSSLVLPDSPQACTMEARVCPDGSAVGRSGPDCAFAQCPFVANVESSYCALPLSFANTPADERVYFAGTVGDKKVHIAARQVRADENRTSYEGRYVFDDESTCGLAVSFAFTSGGNADFTFEPFGLEARGVLCDEGADGSICANEDSSVSLALTRSKTFDLQTFIATPKPAPPVIEDDVEDSPSSDMGIGDGSALSPNGSACVREGGSWDPQHEECVGIRPKQCEAIGGVFNECASACRHNPEADMCTMQCVQVCQL